MRKAEFFMMLILLLLVILMIPHVFNIETDIHVIRDYIDIVEIGVVKEIEN